MAALVRCGRDARADAGRAPPALIWDGLELADALSAGDVTIDGDRRGVTRFLELFQPCQPAAPAA